MGSVVGTFHGLVATVALMMLGFAASVVAGMIIAPRLTSSRPAQKALRKLIAVAFFVAFLFVVIFQRLSQSSAA